MSSVDVLKRKSLSVLREKNLSVRRKKNFQSVKRGKCLSIEFRVFEKNEVRKKCSEKRFLGGNFAKFVFTG